jgi:hypothetical protein
VAKNHIIVMPDADLDQAVDALMGAAYVSTGGQWRILSQLYWPTCHDRPTGPRRRPLRVGGS